MIIILVNYKNVNRYLDWLLKSELLEERDRRYYTTMKGESFLDLMTKIKEMMSMET